MKHEQQPATPSVRMPRTLGNYAVLATLLAALCGCAGRAADPGTSSGAVGSGLIGQVIAASDIAGQADRPLAGQLVLAVALEQAGSALGAGAQAMEDGQLRFLKARLPAASPAIVMDISDADGRYALELDPGTYIVCLADSEQSPPALPATTRGCGRAEASGAAVVDISSGFGEIVLLAR